VFVRTEPTYGIGGERPEGLDCGGGEETAVGYTPTVAWFVSDKLRAGLGVDTVTGDEEIGGCGGAVFEGDSYFIRAAVLWAESQF
jgi:hypothetical protein